MIAKIFVMFQKISISNKCCYFKHYIHLNIPKKMYHGFHHRGTIVVVNFDNNIKCCLTAFINS